MLFPLDCMKDWSLNTETMQFFHWHGPQSSWSYDFMIDKDLWQRTSAFFYVRNGNSFCWRTSSNQKLRRWSEARYTRCPTPQIPVMRCPLAQIEFCNARIELKMCTSCEIHCSYHHNIYCPKPVRNRSGLSIHYWNQLTTLRKLNENSTYINDSLNLKSAFYVWYISCFTLREHIIPNLYFKSYFCLKILFFKYLFEKNYLNFSLNLLKNFRGNALCSQSMKQPYTSRSEIHTCLLL